MQDRIFRLGMLLAAALMAASANAQDMSKYPDFTGQWKNVSGGHFDPGKPQKNQDAPLTAEYRAVFEAGLANQAAGGQGNDQMHKCVPPGMPRTMIVYMGMEIAITPKMTYFMIEVMNQLRRIHTDGRAFPADIEPAFVGYSVGQWVDEDGDGRYDVLLVETRGMKGPRVFDSTGIPLHKDNNTIVKERIFLDKADRDLLRNEVTVIDNALTRPWTVMRTYRREPNPVWTEQICTEDNKHITVGDENYFVSHDGFLMPARKDQPPPDLRYFKPSQQ